MTEQPPKNTKAQLALAIAQGISVAAWARASGVPSATAYRWAGDPVVRKTAETCRRRMMEAANRRMAKHSAWAADEIVRLAKSTESDSVKLEAFRTILANTTGG
jgi:hypothetical protein